MQPTSSSLWWLPILLCCDAVIAAKLCKIGRLTELEGEISGQGGQPMDPSEPAHGCAWHVRPGVWLQAIEFTARGATFDGTDHLSFYASATSRAGLVVRASAMNPLPSQFVLTGSSEVLLVLNAKSTATRFHITYHCRPSGHRFGSFYLPPVIYVAVLAALVFLGLVACLLPLYTACYCCAKRNQDQALQASRLLLHAELAQRREQAREQLARSAALERATQGALEALPTRRLRSRQAEGASEANRRAWEAEACCLCLESFKEQDEVRELPCTHYFHKTCVDTWFASRRYLPRSCPQCRQNPVASAQASGTAEQPGGLGPGAPGNWGSGLAPAARAERLVPAAPPAQPSATAYGQPSERSRPRPTSSRGAVSARGPALPGGPLLPGAVPEDPAP